MGKIRIVPFEMLQKLLQKFLYWKLTMKSELEEEYSH